MSNAPSLISVWQYYVDFYRKLSETPGWSNQAAMLEFVERIAPVAIAENIYPGTSHHILCLSYEYRGHEPTVCIWCGGWRGGTDVRFAVSWVGNWSNSETFERIDDALWQRIVAWLKRSAKDVEKCQSEAEPEVMPITDGVINRAAENKADDSDRDGAEDAHIYLCSGQNTTT